MKVLNLFVYCTVVASAIIPPSQLAPNTIVQATRSDNPSAVDDSLHSAWPHALVARKPSEGQKQAYKAAKQAKGSPSLKAGKHYYFMNCNVAKKDYKPPGLAEEWVLQETKKLKKGFSGCSHVGLVFGKIDRVGTEAPGCKFGCGKSVGTFDATYKHVILKSFGSQGDFWHLKDNEYSALSSQQLFYGGEIDLSKWNSHIDALKKELNTASEIWRKDAMGNSRKGKFDESTNCLTYYRDLKNLLPQKKS